MLIVRSELPEDQGGELSREVVVSKMETVVNRGFRGVVKESVDFSHLDAIIAVGYRVNSIKATRFRQWAQPQQRRDSGSEIR